jgi:hypothetical protein
MRAILIVMSLLALTGCCGSPNKTESHGTDARHTVRSPRGMASKPDGKGLMPCGRRGGRREATQEFVERQRNLPVQRFRETAPIASTVF